MEENENQNEQPEVIQSNSNNEFKGLCIAGLVLGISAIILAWIPILGQILSIVGLVLSIVAMVKLKKVGHKNGMAIAGLVLSIIAFVIGIIIVIIIGGIGAFTYNKVQKNQEINNMISSSMANAEKEIYNDAVEQYTGNSQNGGIVKQLINSIIESNDENIGKNGKFISIETEDITNFDEEDLEDACDKADSNNNSRNVSSAKTEMRNLYSKISSRENYKVKAEYDDGYVTKVIITEK